MLPKVVRDFILIVIKEILAKFLNFSLVDYDVFMGFYLRLNSITKLGDLRKNIKEDLDDHCYKYRKC